MNEVFALLGIAGALSVGVVSPGPSFVMIARTAVATTRGEALAASLGMGIGGLLFAVAALAGLQGLLAAVPSLYVGLKVVGGLYLAWIGVRIWRSAAQPLAVPAGGAPVAARGRLRAFALGLATQVSNPKTAVVYASVFAAFMPQAPGFELSAAILALVLVIETGWYALVALGLSSERPRRAYLRCKRWVDRAAGGVMVGLGLKLVSSAQRA